MKRQTAVVTRILLLALAIRLVDSSETPSSDERARALRSTSRSRSTRSRQIGWVHGHAYSRNASVPVRGQHDLGDAAIARLLDAMRAEEASWAGRCRATNARARSLADVDEAARRACASLAYRDASATAECEQRTAHELRTMVDRADTRKCTPVSCPDTPVVLLVSVPRSGATWLHRLLETASPALPRRRAAATGRVSRGVTVRRRGRAPPLAPPL